MHISGTRDASAAELLGETLRLELSSRIAQLADANELAIAEQEELVRKSEAWFDSAKQAERQAMKEHGIPAGPNRWVGTDATCEAGRLVGTAGRALKANRAHLRTLQTERQDLANLARLAASGAPAVIHEVDRRLQAMSQNAPARLLWVDALRQAEENQRRA